MEKSGEDTQSIRRAAGWERCVDKKLRIEIHDGKITRIP